MVKPNYRKMKNVALVSLFVLFLFSCVTDNEVVFLENQFPQKWQLTEMTGQTPNSETTGAQMSWQEYYLLKADGTFTKAQIRNGVTTEASGTYSFETSFTSNEKYLILTYKTSNSIIGSCTSDLNELLWVKSNTDMISSWMACDGPGLKYERVE